MRKWYREVLKDSKYNVCLSRRLREASRKSIEPKITDTKAVKNEY
jgi:hypothetical protein